MLILLGVLIFFGCSADGVTKVVDETKTVTEIKTQGVFTEVDQVVATYTLYVGQHQTWEDLDLSAYFDGRAVARLHFEAISGCDNEYCTMNLREKDSYYATEDVTVYRGTPYLTDYWEGVTNENGIIEIKSDYGWPVAKTIVIQVTLKHIWN
jgi:hypothetical protein